MAKSVKNNPWQREGVSILPKEPKDLMPIVGQKRLFDMLSRFRETLLTPSANKLSGFFVLHGGWGVGKSRVGHEVCLEAISEDVDWIVEGQPQRLLRGGLEDRILPLFLRYIQVTGGPLGEHLGADNWIASVVVEGRFDLKEVIESLKAYSAIVLPEDRRDHLLICEDKAEFTAQVKGLSPYAEQAEHFADVLHGLPRPTSTSRDGKTYGI